MPLEHDFREPFRCGSCGAKQTVDFGDPNDLTQADVDAVECCYCSTVERLDYGELGDDVERDLLNVRVGEPLKDGDE